MLKIQTQGLVVEPNSRLKLKAQAKSLSSARLLKGHGHFSYSRLIYNVNVQG